MSYLYTHTTRNLFWLFAFIYLISWTILPVIIRHAFTADFIEAAIWSQHFSWGYDKNPWLPAFLTHIGILIGGTSGIGIYFILACSIILGLWCTWQLTSQLSNPIYGIIAALMLAASSWYTVDVQIYNDNYILMGLLPLTSLLFYRALQNDHLITWLSMAASLALATMAKYDAVLLGFAMLIYLLASNKRLFYLTSYKTYAALLVYILIVLPNVIWLFKHDFITIKYAFHDKGGLGEYSFYQHLLKNINFIKEVFIYFLPSLFIMSFIFTSKKTDLIINSNQQTINKDQQTFLFCLALGPILLLVLLACTLGFGLLSEWGMTFVGLWGSYLLVLVKPSISTQSLRRFFIAIFGITIIWPIGYVAISLKNDAGNFPGKELATVTTTIWHERYHQPLAYVAGDRYTVGYINLHSPDKPSVWTEWNNDTSPWINLQDLKCRGAMFVQEEQKHTLLQEFIGPTFPKNVLATFPNLEILPPITLNWYRNQQNKPNPNIIIGLLPPDDRYCV